MYALFSDTRKPSAGEHRNRYGHMGLRRFLAAEAFDPKFRSAPIIAQFSSMGSLSSKWLQEFETSLSAGRVASEGPNGAHLMFHRWLGTSAPNTYLKLCSSYDKMLAHSHASPVGLERCHHVFVHHWPHIFERPCPQCSRRRCWGRPRRRPMARLACS